MEIIKAENLTFTYPNADKAALSDISFSVKSGEFVTICGKSGCGKSTLLRHLKPICTPHGEKSGKIFFLGKDISSLSQKVQSEKIGFVMQSPDNQIVTDKVWHELAFGLESLSLSTAEIRARVAEMASFFGIENWFYKKTSELSGGQKQLLNLASVMVMQPELLILDEPTAQLDPIAAQDFLDNLSRINRELGTAIILSEHRLEEAFPISDKVIVMDEGKIFACGTHHEIGDILKQSNHDMLSALPTPMQVYYSVSDIGNCPITVREGRTWLEKKEIKKDIIFNDGGISKKEPIISLDNVWFRYDKNLPDILKGLSLKVNKGEFYAIVGGNGTGKTTTLSLISGILSPYRGKIAVGATVSALPQNPQILFTKKTILEDLEQMLDDKSFSENEKESFISDIVETCELESLLDKHPYDLSGGEQQRSALAKVLLSSPDILLLDEPTKGLDACFKEKLAELLKTLQNNGITIIMVSHDIEFCAKYADICGMFFDGKIVSESTPRKFFSGKSFYTTAANRMARSILPNAVLSEDIINALGGKLPPKSTALKKKTNFLKEKKENPTGEKKSSNTDKVRNAPARRAVISSLITLFLIPVTILIGMKFFGDRKYYFTSLLIILETMISFGFVFEKRKPRARELVLISALCAITVVSRAAFYMLPQFKPVVALIIISGVCFGGETGFLVGAVSAFVSNFFFGQGPWTPWQMFAFGITGFLSGVIFNKRTFAKSKIALSAFGFLVTLFVYGGIMNPAALLMQQPNPTFEMIIASYIAGFPLDIIHSVSTVFFLWLASETMIEKLDRIKIKYGLTD